MLTDNIYLPLTYYLHPLPTSSLNRNPYPSMSSRHACENDVQNSSSHSWCAVLTHIGVPSSLTLVLRPHSLQTPSLFTAVIRPHAHIHSRLTCRCVFSSSMSVLRSHHHRSILPEIAFELRPCTTFCRICRKYLLRISSFFCPHSSLFVIVRHFSSSHIYPTMINIYS